MKRIVYILFIIFLQMSATEVVFAQDTNRVIASSVQNPIVRRTFTPKYKLDSIYNAYLRPIKLDSIRVARQDSISQSLNTVFFDFMKLKRKTAVESKNENYQFGTERRSLDRWNVYALLLVLCLFILISYFFAKDIYAILQGFISNRVLNLAIRDNNVLNSESFLFIAVFISFTYGYLMKVLFNIENLFNFEGWMAYVTLSGLIMLYFGLKTILLRIAGAVFSVKNLVGNFISITYISFCAFSVVIFPLLIFYTLGPVAFAHQLIVVFAILLILSLVYQYLRGVLYISSNFQFPKFYFIIYLCAFEICPLIILYKVLLN